MFLPRLGTSNHSLRLTQSLISRHLLDNQDCASKYMKNSFTVLHRDLSAHNLSPLEADHIKLDQPSMCKQTEQFIRSFNILGGM